MVMNFNKPIVLASDISEIVEPYLFGKVLRYENLGGIPNTTFKIITQQKTFAIRIYSHGQSSIEHIKMEIDLLKHLERKCFPSPRVLAGKNGEILQQWKGYYTCATDYITGEMADSGKITPKLAFNVGKIVAQLNRAMYSFNLNDIPAGETFIERGEYVIKTLTEDLYKRGWDMNVANVSRQWTNASEHFIKYSTSLDCSIISADIWPPNIKHIKSEVKALMDFDDCCYGAQIIDLGIALMSFSMIDNIKLDKRIATHLLTGYFEAGGKTTELEENLIVDAIEMASAMWLGYNVIQAPRYEQAEIYLIQLNMLNNKKERKGFCKDISDVIKKARFKHSK